MDNAEAKERFDKANALYSAGHYEESLAELDELASQFPNHPVILDGKARALEHLGRYDEALALFNRLVDELGHERARPRRDRLQARLAETLPATAPVAAPSSSAIPVEEDDAEAEQEYAAKEMTPGSTKRRFRIKPIRLLLLAGILAGMYFGKIPYWLGVGLIVLYFSIKYAIRVAFIRLLTVPFKMKGKALAGATAQVHGFEWTEAPAKNAEDEEEEEEKPAVPLRYVWIDVTITPPVRTQGFTHWEPGELVLAPAAFKYRTPDDLDKCFRIEQVRFLNDGKEEDDEGYKVAGPQRLKILAGVPVDQDAFKFAYYFETFGNFQLRR